MNDASVNHFARLSAINVSEHIERKGGFAYLSWPFAVSQLRLAEPTAIWEVRRFNGLPYLASEAGVFVEVAVTVQGVTLSQIHPVLDGRNRPLLAPTAFDINTSIQRCLVKAIALHGLGLYIYAGEDLPSVDGGAAANDGAGSQPGQPRELPAAPAPVPVAKGPRITAFQQAQLQRLAAEVGCDIARVLDYFGISQLKDLPMSEFQRAVRSLEKRRAA